MLCSYEDQLNRQQMNNNNNNMMNTPAHQASMGWYSGYHQAPQMYSPPNAYYMHQEEQNVWPHHHHHHHHVPQHSQALFPNEYADFLGHNNYIQPAPVHPLPVAAENQIPSPPCGSEISSSSTGGNITPPAPSSSRPAPVRSPYEWIKKPSYQNQPNPELDCPKAEPLLLDFTTTQETHGKTRTKDKYRVVYSDVQRVELEREFHFHNKYITIRRKSELAVLLGLSDRQIKIWFQNRRAKERKQLKKAAEENAREMNRANNNHEIPSFEGMINQQMMQPSNALPVEQLLPVPSSHPIVHPTYAEGHNHLAERLMKLEVNDDHIG